MANNNRHGALLGALYLAGRRSLDGLSHLPVMTKGQMMERFDEVCTDRRLTRAAVDAHVWRLGEDLELLEGEYVVFASGGS